MHHHHYGQIKKGTEQSPAGSLGNTSKLSSTSRKITDILQASYQAVAPEVPQTQVGATGWGDLMPSWHCLRASWGGRAEMNATLIPHAPILLHWGRDFSRDEVLFSRVHLKHRLSPVTPLCFQGPVSSCLVRSKPSHTTISSVRMDLSSFFLPMILLLKDCTEYYNVFTNCPTRTTKWDFTKQFIRLPRYNLHFNTATSVSRRDTTNPTVLSKPLISTSVRWDSWEHPSRLRYTVPWFVHKVI